MSSSGLIFETVRNTLLFSGALTLGYIVGRFTYRKRHK